MLPRQTQMVSRVRNDLGREWANELFSISFQTKGTQRSWAQSTAMSVLVRLDPDRALELIGERVVGIDNLNGQIFVTYAKINPANPGDDLAGAGQIAIAAALSRQVDDH